MTVSEFGQGAPIVSRVEGTVYIASSILAILIVNVETRDVKHASLIPAPFLFFVLSQNFKNGVIPCASKILSAYVIRIAVNSGFAERLFCFKTNSLAFNNCERDLLSESLSPFLRSSV